MLPGSLGEPQPVHVPERETALVEAAEGAKHVRAGFRERELEAVMDQVRSAIRNGAPIALLIAPLAEHRIEPAPGAIADHPEVLAVRLAAVFAAMPGAGKSTAAQAEESPFGIAAHERD